MGFPRPWLIHVEELLALEGDLRRHALVIFSSHLRWFFMVDSNWTETNLISIFGQAGEDQNAVWAGFLKGARGIAPQLYGRIKPHLLKFAQRKFAKHWDNVEMLSGLLLDGWGSIDQETGERFVTNIEMRDALIHADEEFHSRVLWQIWRWLDGGEASGWKEKLPDFLSEVWPRQKNVKSPKVSSRLCDIAFTDADSFPKIVDLILPLVTPADQEHLSLPQLRRSKDTVVDEYPEKTLALLSAILPEQVYLWPYDIEDVLKRIEDADSSLMKDSRLIELKRRWNAR